MTQQVLARAVTLCLCALPLACGGLQHRVEREALMSLGLDAKLQLFDAENDLMIALDEKEQIRRQIRDMKDDIQDAERQTAEALSDRERAQSKGDEKAADVAAFAYDVFGLKIEYLEASLDLLRDRLDAQDELILMAQARFELAKARLVLKNNVRSTDELNIDDFTNQVDAIAERARDSQAAIQEDRKEVEEVRAFWLQERQKLHTLSGGALGNAWVEDGVAWEAQ